MKLKKGFIFSLFVITALSLVVLTFKMKTEFREEQRAEIFMNRIGNVNLFIEDMKIDIERSLYVSSFRAFLAVDEYIHSEVDYIDDVYLRIPELVLNGTIDGNMMEATNSSTFSEWIRRIKEIAEKYKINLTFKDINISVKQQDQWKINITFDANISINDFDDLIEWNFSLTESTLIDISRSGLPDPIYFVESLSNYGENVEEGVAMPLLNNIKRTPYSSFWFNDTSKPEPDYVIVDKLINHTEKQYYRESVRAPSYLMRLEGDFGASPLGIESFVFVNDSTAWHYSEEDDTTCAADYQFFSVGCSNKNRIVNMENRFYLDTNHLIDYDLMKINDTDYHDP